jgi:D-glycero-alpha-D-manno-heptose-7-phosphate kinase
MAPIVNVVSTQTPLRVSFFGGGSDFPSFFIQDRGLVVSSAINQFIYVTVKRHSVLFGEKYRISYSETEHTNSISDIKNGIVRSCLELVGIQEPLFISTSSDVPAMSGLGSSSSFAVGLLNALHVMMGHVPSPGQLAEEACEVELVRLQKPIGKQDQYAAAFGGMNSFEFRSDGRVSVDSLTIRSEMSELLKDLVLVWTGIPRTAESILQEQNDRTSMNVPALNELVGLAETFKKMILEGTLGITALAEMLTLSWEIKRGLASGVTSSSLDSTFDQILKAGALGGKVLGAGGGGFYLACVPQSSQMEFKRRVSPLITLPLTLESQGSRVVSKISL